MSRGPGAATTLVLDLGDVVCRFTPAARTEALVALTGLDAGAVEAAVWGSGLDERAEAGAVPPDDIAALVADALGVAVAPDRLRAAWSRAFTPDSAVLAVVDELAEPPVLFTNNGPLLTQALAHELAPVARRFASCVCSWQLGRRKPDPEAFRALADRVGRAPRDLVLVDDSAANVESARALGVDAVVYSNAADLRRALGERDLLG